MRKQVFAKVLTDFSIHGKLAPVSITWPDGRVLQVDRILDIRFAPR